MVSIASEADLQNCQRVGVAAIRNAGLAEIFAVGGKRQTDAARRQAVRDNQKGGIKTEQRRDGGWNARENRHHRRWSGLPRPRDCGESGSACGHVAAALAAAVAATSTPSIASEVIGPLIGLSDQSEPQLLFWIMLYLFQ
jgi:hypothetical protein